jgi:hypothetical protein
VGTLPFGLGLNTTTGIISGTPTSASTASFTISVTDALGQMALRDFTITIIPAVGVSTTSLLNGAVGSAYSGVLAAFGGVPPYSWTITVGALPNGLNLNGATGTITGTPNAAGTSNFTATVTDALGGTSSRALSITVSNPPPPTLARLFPDVGPLNGSVDVQLTGTNFVPGNSSLLFNAPGISVSNLVVVNSTLITATFNINLPSMDSREVRVQTPGGTSSGVWIDLRSPPTINSLTPASGNRGTSVNVTFGGFVLRAPLTVNVSGTGITVTNVVSISGVQATATFVIDAAAPTGPRSVTVSGPSGTSNVVTFTVN